MSAVVVGKCRWADLVGCMKGARDSNHGRGAFGAVRGLCCGSFFFSSRRRHTRFKCDWSSDVCSSDLFGQRILTLRTSIGLTQAGLGERLRVSRRAVAEWEAGSSYPKAKHLQEFIALAVRASAFPAGREAEEVRVLWHAAHQKLLLDEAWLASLLDRPRPALTLLHRVPLEAPRPAELPPPEPPPVPQLEWGEALAVPTFYDREQELATLTRWVVGEGCRLAGVLGMGGMGKSARGARARHQWAMH